MFFGLLQPCRSPVVPSFNLSPKATNLDSHSSHLPMPFVLLGMDLKQIPCFPVVESLSLLAVVSPVVSVCLVPHDDRIHFEYEIVMAP